jgi:hypothetical protein
VSERKPTMKPDRPLSFFCRTTWRPASRSSDSVTEFLGSDPFSLGRIRLGCEHFAQDVQYRRGRASADPTEFGDEP